MGIMDSLLQLAVPAAVSIGGAMLKNSAEKKAQKKQAQILSTIDAMKTQNQNRNLALTQSAVQQYTPQRRMPTLENSERRLTQQFTRDATSAPAVGIGPVYSGNVSDDYLATAATRKAEELQRATKLASLLGRASAPADVALTEGINNQNAALERYTNDANLRGDINTQQLALNAVEPSAAKYMAGDFLQGAGLRMGASRLIPWGGKPKAAPPVNTGTGII